MHPSILLQHKFVYAFNPIKCLNTTSSTPYAQIRSKECSNLPPKVAEYSLFNCPAVVQSVRWPSHLNLQLVLNIVHDGREPSIRKCIDCQVYLIDTSTVSSLIVCNGFLVICLNSLNSLCCNFAWKHIATGFVGQQ